MELEVFRLMLITDDGSSSHLLCLTHDIYFYICLVQIIIVGTYRRDSVAVHFLISKLR
jgi:hypothetical protein